MQRKKIAQPLLASARAGSFSGQAGTDTPEFPHGIGFFPPLFEVAELSEPKRQSLLDQRVWI